MADNRYNVDDILREVKEKRDREERAAQTGKRPPATPEDLLRQLDAAGAGLSGAKPAPQKPKREGPKREQPTPAELLQRAEPPAVPAPKPEPEFKWEEPQQPEEWLPPQPEKAAPAPESRPAAKPKAPLWEASAARKRAETVMQSLKKQQRGFAVTLIINLIMLAGVVYLALAPIYHLLLPGALAHPRQRLSGADPRPPKQRRLCDPYRFRLPFAGQLYVGAARPAGAVRE